jgi:hypothetical protein
VGEDVYWHSDRELVEGIVERIQARSFLWFWFRDMCLEAERRGLVAIAVASDGSSPFWWDTSRVTLTQAGQGLWDTRRI